MRYFNVFCFVCLTASLTGQPFHPADQDSDQTISLEEVTAYAKAHSEGTAWPSGPSPVTEDDLARARFIWQNGERYSQVAGVPEEHSWIPAPLDGTRFLTLVDLTPEPLDGVEIFGLPEGMQGLVLEYRPEGATTSRFALLDPLEDDRWMMYVPYLDDAPGGAGPMELWILSETERFPLVSIHSQPLPPAPGTAAALSAGLTALSTLTGELLGSDPTPYLNSPPGAIPPTLQPVVMIDRMLRDPENPNNLTAFLNGTAPVWQDLEMEVTEIEPLLAKMGLVERTDELQALLTESLSGTPASAPAGLRQLSSPVSVRSESIFISIANLGQLAEAMNKQCAADRMANPSPEVQNLKTKANIAAAIVGLAGPVGAVAAASFSVGNWALDTYSQVIANSWPSDVSNGQLHFSPTFSVEDDCDPASWELTFNASSRDWSLDKTVVTGAISFLSAYKAGSEALSATANLGLRAGVAASAEDATGTATGLINEFSNMTLDKTFPSTAVIPIPKSVWSGIRVTDGDFGLIEVEYEGSSVKQGATLRDIVPNEVGLTTIRVRTQPGALGSCAGVEGAAQTYEVRENKISLTPSGGQVKANDEITFTAVVTDANNLALEFEVSHGVMFEENHNLTTGVHVGKWRAPPEAEMPDGPITITARSLASECLREGVERSREAILTPFETEYILIPSSVTCLPEGAQETFEVLDVKFGEVPPVTWELIGSGSLAPSGSSAVFTAGQPGQVSIRATVETEEEPVVLEQLVTVGCDLSAGWFFPSSAQPVQGGSFGSLSAGFIISDVGAMVGDLYIEYTSVEPPVDGSPVGQVRGTFSGAGMYLPGDLAEFERLVDESEAERIYSGPTNQGTTAEYSVMATFHLADFSPEEQDTRLPDGPNGVSMEISLDGSGSFAGGYTGFEDNEIVQYIWSFSDGDQLGGAEVTKTFSRSLDELVITLRVVDKRGNWAERKETLIIVQATGTFAFPYEPSGLSVGVFPWNSEMGPAPPPAFTGDGYLVFMTDPADSTVVLELSGGRSGRATAKSSVSVLLTDEDPPLYSIGFLTTGGFGEE